MADKGAVGCTSLTGEEYSLKNVPGSIYRDGLISVIPIKDDLVYFYIYDETCILPESLPDIVVPTDNLTGIGAWKRTNSDAALKDVTEAGMFVRTLQGWMEIDNIVGGGGTYWFSGSEEPTSIIGNPNDFYLDRVRYNLYKKSLPVYDLSDVFSGGIALADSEDPINTISKAFDGSDITYYQSTAAHATIIYDFGEAVANAITKVRINRRVDDIKTINIYGSNDNVEYTLLSANVLLNSATGWVDIEFFNDVAYRYIKLDMLDTYSTNDITIYELEAYVSDSYDWEFICNIRGTTGNSGTAWTTGTHAIPLAEEGNPGDFYLYETLFAISRKDLATYELTPSLSSSEVDVSCNAVTDCADIFAPVDKASGVDISTSYIKFTYSDQVGKTITKISLNTTNVSKLLVEGSNGDELWDTLNVCVITVDGDHTYEFVNTKQYIYYRLRVTELLAPGTWYLNDLSGWEATSWDWRSIGSIKGSDGYGLMEGSTIISEDSTIDFNDWQHKNIIITANVNLTLDFPRGGIYSLKIHQDNTGGRTFTFTNNIHWLGGIEPGWITDPDSYCVLSFRFDGTVIDSIGDVVFEDS